MKRFFVTLAMLVTLLVMAPTAMAANWFDVFLLAVKRFRLILIL